jgi:hypothetical protein
MAVSRNLRRRVVQRAANICEYCQMPQDLDVAHFEMDHIRAQVHGARTVYENLAWACFRCNNAKGTNLAGIDSETDEVERLFHPRRDNGAPTLNGMDRSSSARLPLAEPPLECSASTPPAASRFGSNSSMRESFRQRRTVGSVTL